MEVDERLRWLEARISTSLRPRGDELRNLLTQEENRSAFLAFCNHSESRRLFVYLIPDQRVRDYAEGVGQIRVSATPPRNISDKALFFLKCNHASKLNRESMGADVVYSECSTLPLDHLEIVMREVYLPLLSSRDRNTHYGMSDDKLMDLLHRLVGSMQVTSGQSDGKVVLPLPSMEVLSEAALHSDRRGAVIHIMESSVISWMKQVKAAMHLDPNSSILKAHGKYAGPLSEYEFWSSRLSALDSVRNQLSSGIVLNILRSLDKAHSTYSQAFIHVHRDVGKAISDTEHTLVYLNTLQPWLVKLSRAFSPESQIQIFPSLMMTLLLVWQHSGVYSFKVHFYRLLRLLSNDIMLKAKETIGEEVLRDPEQSLTNIKLALRVCAEFRGCYLDFREKSETIAQKYKERSSQSRASKERSMEVPRKVSNGPPVGELESKGLCPWPPRNSPVFGPLNAIMERCNDLLELVQTLRDFRELESYPFGYDGSEHTTTATATTTTSTTCGMDPIIGDIHKNFKSCMSTFQNQTKDVLNLEPDCSFEENFFHFRSKVKGLEQFLVPALNRAFVSAPTLQAQLRVLEMYQGVSRRDNIKANLQPQLNSIITKLILEMESVGSNLATNLPHPPPRPLTPPTACKLLWLHALRERTNQPMEVIRRVAPELLEGDEGWKLRQAYAQLIGKIENHISQTESSWSHNVPIGLHKKLRENILTRNPDSHLVVNFDPTLSEVLSEIRYLTRPPLGLRLPITLRQLKKSTDYSELKHRQTSLQVVVQAYNELQDSLSDIDRMLLQHKLQQIEKLLQMGIDELDWVSTAFPDFIAKANAAVCGELQNTMDQVHGHVRAITAITEGWSKIERLDMFKWNAGPQDLAELETAHQSLLESLQSCLPPSMERITQHVTLTFQCIHEASQESPAWVAYLEQIDSLVVSGLKDMLLAAISTLVGRALKYEQGGQIPVLVMVELELQGSNVMFSPPLSAHSAISSVPEVVQKWMSNLLHLARLGPRFSPGVGDGSCLEVLRANSDIKNAMSKICAHLETNSRQCQSLRKRFTMYSFLWEQDVGGTFADFLRGQAVPHPRRFTRPETVQRSRASARAHSASSTRPKSSTMSLSAPEPNLQAVTGVTDWDFLRPSSASAQDDHAHRPSLDDFDGEISVFQGILDRLHGIEKVNNVGWVCVDQRPVKQALSSLANKWKHVYASHLEKQVALVLSNLETFFQEVEPKVDAISGEESDTLAFMKLMSIFNQVNTQQLEMDTKFGTAHRAMQMLDKFDHPLSHDLRKQFNNAPTRWSNLKKRVALGKQRIGPRIQAKGDLISQDLSRFGEIFTSLRARFGSSQCLRHTLPRDQALEMLGGYAKEMQALQIQAKDLIELQELLETSIFNFSLLKEFEDELSTLHELWNMYESIMSQHASWHKKVWTEIEMTELLESVDKQLQIVGDLPAKIVQDWDLHIHLMETVRIVRVSLPLVEGLKSPAMRPRHWKQVLRHSSTPAHLLGRGGTFDPALLEELTFGQLLDMRLHCCAEEVCALVERASKDVAIESLLNTFEEVWLSRQLELKVHKRTHDSNQPETISDLAVDTLSHASATPKSRATSARVTSGVRKPGGVAYPVVSTTPGGIGPAPPRVLLLSCVGSSFETLESHQTSLQSLEGTVAAASFADELHKWHKQLQTIEAVLIIWLKVQQLWVQLEEVYQSSDIQQHLSSYAFSFSNADREFRELMSHTAKNPAILSVCLKDGLLLSLEKLHSTLVLCQAALVQYVEGQRLKCSWFYLLPLEDILQLMCYGSSLQQLSKYIPKLLCHVSSLELDGGLNTVCGSYYTPSTGKKKDRGERSVGVSMITALIGRSGEKMDLLQSIPCEGSIEGIISNILSSTSSTLQSHLSSAITNCSKILSTPSTSSESSLSALHGLWSSTLPTHTVVLTTLVILESVLLKASQEASASGEKRPLDDMYKEIRTSLKILSHLMQGRAPDEGQQNGDIFGSNMATKQGKESQSNIDAVASVDGGESSPSDIFSVDRESSPARSERSRQHRGGGNASPHRVRRLQRLAFVLYGYKHKISQLCQWVESQPSQALTHSPIWETMLHFEWSSEKKASVVSALGASLVNKCGYSDILRPHLNVPQSEKGLHTILQAVEGGASVLLTGGTSIGKNSIVRELSMYTGRQLHFFHCSPQVSHNTMLNLLRGMADTGCWLYLHCIDQLQPQVLQATCSLLSLIQEQAWRSGGDDNPDHTPSSTVQWAGEQIKVSLAHPGVCFASINTPLTSHDYSIPPALPASLADAFVLCSVETPDTMQVLKAMFSTHQFENTDNLAKSLHTFCGALKELSKTIPVMEHSITDAPSSFVSLYMLETIVSLSHKHMSEFYSMGAIEDQESGQHMSGDGLHMSSLVYSEISQGTRVSVKTKRPAGNQDNNNDDNNSNKNNSNREDDVSKHKALQRHSLEEFSVVLALKDAMLCSVFPGSVKYSVVTRLISDVFPNCDIEGLLAHEANVRKGMAAKSRQNRNAVESAHESRAASVMQMMQEESHPSEAISNLEEQIVQSCHLHHLVPTPEFQAAVAQIMNLVQVSRFVAVCGPSGCGKTAAIQVAAETFRHASSFSQIRCISTTTIAVGAMREEQLMGYQCQTKGLWQDGVLPRILNSTLSTTSADSGEGKGGSTSQWFVLEGPLTHGQMDTLASCHQEDNLTLSNGHTVILDSSVRFILELPDSAAMTSSLRAKTARVAMSQDTISWNDVLIQWLHRMPDLKPTLWDTVEDLFDKYLPLTLEFLSPVLSEHASGREAPEVSSTSVTATLTLEDQDLKLTKVQLINSCCRIFQSVLPTSSSGDSQSFEDLEYHCMYSVVWACGGYLTASNKAHFDQWWRSTFSPMHPAHRYPEGGTLWDYYIKPGTHGFQSWKNNLPQFSLTTNKTAPPFICTTRVAAVMHLLSLQMSRGYPVLLNGAGGSGKTSLLEYFLREFKKPGMTDANLLHVYCNHLTSAGVIWNQVLDHLEWDWGKKYVPKDGKKLVCFIDDLHNTEDTSCGELLRQHLAVASVCDPATGKWHEMSDVCYLITANHSPSSPSSSSSSSSQAAGLPSQLLKQCVVLQWDDYSSEELVYILDTLLSASCLPGNLNPSLESPVSTPKHRPLTSDLSKQLVRATVQIHSKLKTMFLATPERLHYRFSLNDLMAVFRYLCTRFSGSDVINLQHFLLEWQVGVWWKWAGQMSSQVDRDRYWEVVSHALKKFFNQDKVLPVLLAENSCRLSQEAIDELKVKLKSEVSEYNISHPTLHINLYDNTVEEVWHLCRIINSPPDLGHMIMLGHTHPEPLVRLAALHCGYSVVQTTQNSSQNLHMSSEGEREAYSVPQFRRDLIAICTTSGTRNERIVLLLTDKQLFDQSLLTCVYEIVKGYAISALFSKEEQAKIINGVRGDLTQSGLAFSQENAWDFFLKRVRCNLRVVVSLPELRGTIKTGCHKWKELLSSMSIYYELPWERKRLVEAATHHLEKCEYLSAGQVESLAHLVASIHLQLRTRKDTTASNTTYQYFVERFVYELNEVQTKSQSSSVKLSQALRCFSHATEQVSSLQERIRRETVVLGEKSEACNKLLIQIGQDTAISCQHSKLVAKQKERITHLKKVTPDFEHAHSIAVQDKESLVSSSRDLVSRMDQQSLAELRSLQRPPPDIEELLVTVITILKGTSADFSWTKGAKRLMANLDRFRELLLEYSGREDNSETLLEVLDPVVMKPSFSTESFAKHPIVGMAASQLSEWVQRVLKLHSTLQTKIRPLQMKVANMKVSWKEYSDKLKKEESKVSVLDERLAGLSTALENASMEKSKQRNLLSSMKKELKETHDFISSLSGLHKDWEKGLALSTTAISHNVGALCLSTSLACYLASAEPHVQMEVVNVLLVPVLQERGVSLHWRTCNTFMQAIAGISTDTLKSCDIARDSVEVERSDAEMDNQPTVPQEEDDVLSRSHASLSGCMLGHMISETLVDRWLSLPVTHHSLSYLLCSCLVFTSWNRWPLVVDPQNLAFQCILQCRKEVVCLDGADSSSGFYLSLEHALVHGEAVIVRHFPCPVNPALQPLIELGHTWNLTKDCTRVIHFCGRRLHVHPDFHLYLTTTMAPSALPPSLISDLNIINLCPSVPLSQDLLLDETLRLLLPDESTGFSAECAEIATQKEVLGKLENDVFDSLPKDSNGGSYWHSTDLIVKTVQLKDEISDKLQSSMEAVNHSCQQMSLLNPIARHGALVYNAMCHIGGISPQSMLSWKHFVGLYSEALSEYAAQHPDLAKTISEGSDHVTVFDDIIQRINQTLLQDAFRYMNDHTWTMLASVMTLLTASRLSHTSTVPLAEQLLYLAHGELALSEMDTPPQATEGAQIPHDVWDTLQRIPLSLEYYSMVVQSLQTHPQFWERAFGCSGKKEEGGENTEEEIVEGGGTEVVRDLSDFPWTSRGGPDVCVGLDDYVLLKFLREESCSGKVSSLVGVLVGATHVSLLSDVLLERPSETVLLFYDESCPRSQALMYTLQRETKEIMKEKTLVALRVSAGVEEEATKLLLKPKSEVLLLMDIQFGSQHWLDLLLWRTEQAVKSGCRVICTASLRSSLSAEFVGTCHTAHLSRLATAATQTLPREAWMVDRYSESQPPSFCNLLWFNLANLPRSLLSKAERLTATLQPVLFSLAVVHTAVSMFPIRGNTLVASHYKNLLTSAGRLLSRGHLELPTVLRSLSVLVVDLYSGCAPKERLQALVEEVLTVESCSPGARVRPHPGVEITVPTSAVTPDKLAEHAGEMAAAGSEVPARDYTAEVNGAIDDLLLPLLTSVPSPELYNLPITTTTTSSILPPPPSPSHDTLSAQSRAVVRSLEYCYERLPQPLSPTGAISETLRAELMKQMSLCSQLEAVVDYHFHGHHMSVSHFNSALLSIQQDIDTLTRFADIAFDGLPEQLQQVLASVEAGVMPKRWRGRHHSQQLPITLDQGLQELADWRATLSPP